MEQTIFARSTRIIVGCITSGLLLLLLTAALGPMPALSGITGLLLFTGVLLSAWIGTLLWSAMRGEPIVYRIFYHAEEKVEYEGSLSIFRALARNAGPITLLWRIGYLEAAEEKSPSLSLYIIAPVGAAKALEGALPSMLPGILAERCALPLSLTAASNRRKNQTLRFWRWRNSGRRHTGTLADPLACGAHLKEMARFVQILLGPGAEIESAEVRLKLWSTGASAIVAASYSMVDKPASWESGAHADFLLPFPWAPKPLFRRPLKFRARRRSTRSAAVDAQAPVTRLYESAQKPASSIGRAFCEFLVAWIAFHYPLWEKPGADAVPRWRQQKSLWRTASPARTVPEERVAAKPQPTERLLFSPTTRYYSTLDSVLAGEVPPAPDYALPPVSEQVFALGTATADGRVIGVPALRALPYISASAPGVPETSEAGAKPGTGLPFEKRRRRAALHPIMAEHLLVAGGTEKWRRDVSGSLTSQALEIGMMVISVYGGQGPTGMSTSLGKHRIVSPAALRELDGWQKSMPLSSESFGAPSLVSSSAVHKEHLLATFPDATIDMANPAGSVHPNVLFVEAPGWLPGVQGEAFSFSLALETGLSAQMEYLRAVNVIGVGVGAHLSQEGVPGAGREVPDAGGLIVEAWLILLLLRHHRARLIYAMQGAPFAPGKKQGRNTNSEPGGYSARVMHVPPCPDLPALFLVLEHSNLLLGMLKKEHAEWHNVEWTALVETLCGADGTTALEGAQAFLRRAQGISNLNPGDLVLYSAAVRSRLAQLLEHRALARMLGGPHISLATLLDRPGVRHLSVNLDGAYKALSLNPSQEAVARKRYGLYLLWAVRALSRQRSAIAARLQACSSDVKGEAGSVEPLLLVLHGAGGWFGADSPLSERSLLKELAAETSGIALVATLDGLRHMRAYRETAFETFGTVMLGTVPACDPESPLAAQHLVDVEVAYIRAGLEIVAGAFLPTVSHALGVLHRLGEEQALIATRMPGGRRVVCTARVSPHVVDDVRTAWSNSPAS